MFIDVQVFNFWNVLDVLDVGSIASSPKNTGNFSLRVDIMRSDKCSRGVVDQCRKFDG
jgi:hypothetical protein